jgi:hypothetical protein
LPAQGGREIVVATHGADHSQREFESGAWTTACGQVAVPHYISAAVDGIPDLLFHAGVAGETAAIEKPGGLQHEGPCTDRADVFSIAVECLQRTEYIHAGAKRLCAARSARDDDSVVRIETADIPPKAIRD